jgi:hypothetical protein
LQGKAYHGEHMKNLLATTFALGAFALVGIVAQPLAAQ